ncbi:Translocation and assembly module subunit TamA [Oligella sp. MSHR50489EDL]|uniref:autotransporter assembly complex protein TamA n=1 Tax=Oligella sp. MSHR50489EDL TaxID=3139409 RepID=UPI003D816035
MASTSKTLPKLPYLLLVGTLSLGLADSAWSQSDSLSGPIYERERRLAEEREAEAAREAQVQALEIENAEAKIKVPEVVIIPGGLSPEDLAVVDAAISSVVRQADDQDSREADRIRRRGRDAVLSSLATRGYFDPKVTLEVGEDFEGETWDISIEPGELTHVNSVSNEFTGTIAKSPTYQQRIEGLRKDWGLPKGKVFINKVWSRSKSKLLEDVASRDFYLARMTHSQALIDPDEATADLTTVIDSGPAVRLGHTEVQGIRRVPISLIRRYIRYEPGEEFSQEKLDEWQQTLQSTNFFRGAFVTIKKPDDPGVYEQDEATLPVLVRVTEGPARIMSAAVGIDDVNTFRVEGVYRQNVVWNQALTLETGASLGLKEQRGYLDIYRAPNYDGTVDSFGIMARHSDYSDEEVTRFALGWKRTNEFKLDPASRVEFESRYSAAIAYDAVKRLDQPKFELPNAVVTYDLLRRDVDSKFDPRSGNLIVLGLGIGADLERGDPFARTSLRAQQWWAVGRRDNITVRAEVGYVHAKSTTRIPDDFGYRTGGAGSIRGYRYFGIGEQSYKSVIGTRALAVAGVEYTHYFNNTFGMAFFVDAGDAARKFKDMKLHVGTGVGARVKTPAGPLFFDIAYGHRDRKIRWHFSLGMAF